MTVKSRDYTYQSREAELDDERIIAALDAKGARHVCFNAGSGISLQTVVVGEVEYRIERIFVYGEVAKVTLLRVLSPDDL